MEVGNDISFLDCFMPSRSVVYFCHTWVGVIFWHISIVHSVVKRKCYFVVEWGDLYYLSFIPHNNISIITKWFFRLNFLSTDVITLFILNGLLLISSFLHFNISWRNCIWRGHCYYWIVVLKSNRFLVFNILSEESCLSVSCILIVSNIRRFHILSFDDRIFLLFNNFWSWLDVPFVQMLLSIKELSKIWDDIVASVTI